MLKQTQVKNTYARAFQLATLALEVHAKRHFPKNCPPRWKFWERVSIVWEDFEFRFDDGDQLPGVPFQPVVNVAGNVKIGTRLAERVDVTVFFVSLSWNDLPTTQAEVYFPDMGGRRVNGRRGKYTCGSDLPTLNKPAGLGNIRSSFGNPVVVA